eukprot:1473277-Alexandrium_andersonii.AAC.1
MKPAKPAAPCTKIPLDNIGDENVREQVREWRAMVEQAIEQKSWDVVREARLCEPSFLINKHSRAGVPR